MELILVVILRVLRQNCFLLILLIKFAKPIDDGTAHQIFLVDLPLHWWLGLRRRRRVRLMRLLLRLLHRPARAGPAPAVLHLLLSHVLSFILDLNLDHLFIPLRLLASRKFFALFEYHFWL